MDLELFKSEVNKKVTEVRTRMERTWPGRAFPVFTWGLDAGLPIKTSGRAHRYINHFTLNPRYVEKYARELIDKTTPNEIGHLVCYILYPWAKQHHGPEFRTVLRAMGYYQSAKTYHNYHLDEFISRPKIRYAACCTICGAVFNLTTFKARRIHLYHCRKDKGALVLAESGKLL